MESQLGQNDSQGLSDTERQLKLLESIQQMKQELQQKTYLVRSLHNQLTQENSRVEPPVETAHSHEIDQPTRSDKRIQSLQHINLEYQLAAHLNLDPPLPQGDYLLQYILTKYSRFQVTRGNKKLEISQINSGCQVLLELHFKIGSAYLPSRCCDLMLLTLNDKRTGKELLQICREPECVVSCVPSLSSRHYDIQEQGLSVGSLQVMSLFWVRYVVLYDAEQQVQYILRVARTSWAGDYSLILKDKYDRIIGKTSPNLEAPLQVEYSRHLGIEEKKALLVVQVFTWFLMTHPWKH